MAFVFHCPQCASILKTGAPIPEGRTIQCPKCNNVFTSTETTVQPEEPGLFPAPAPLLDPPPPVARSDERDMPRRHDEDDRQVRRDDRERDDRDRPRSRRREADDERTSRRRRDDEYDRPRRRRDYDDDYDRRPRSRPRARTNTTLFVVLGIIGALIAGAIVIGIIAENDDDVARQPFAPGVDTEMLALAPSDTVLLMGIDVNELKRNGKFARLIGNTIMQQLPERQLVERKFEEAGLSENDVSGVLIATSSPGGSGPVVVIRFNRDIDQKRLINAFNGHKVSDKFKKYFTSETLPGSYFFFAGKRLLVIVDDRDTMQKLLHHDRTKVQLSQEMRDAASKASGQYWMVMKKEGGADAMKGFGMGFGADDIFGGFANQTEAIVVTLAAQNDQLECEIGLKLAANKNAADVSQQMQREINNIRQIGVKNHPNFRDLPADDRAVAEAIQQSATFRSEGSTAYMKYRVNIGMFERLMQMNQKGALNRPRFGL